MTKGGGGGGEDIEILAAHLWTVQSFRSPPSPVSFEVYKFSELPPNFFKAPLSGV